MIGVKEIQEYRTYLVDTVYALTTREQRTDQTYINDTFPVPEVKEIDGKQIIFRSGYGVRIVDAPADQIVTKNPQVFVETTARNKSAAENVAKYFNQEFIEVLKRANPNMWKEHIKGQLGCGQAFYKIIHNESWINPKMKQQGLPVLFPMLSPMVIFASPEEDDNGIPERVVVQYERQVSDIAARYPKWSNPKKDANKKTCLWMEYWDKDVNYWEADGEAVRPSNGGIYPNIYGVVPFVRKFSGFGRQSPDGDMSNLIVSDIRYSRDLIREECFMKSTIASEYILFTHPDLFILAEGDLPKPEDTNASMQIGGANVNQLANFKGKLEWNKIEPSAQMSQQHQSVIAALNQRHPLIMAGLIQGDSGRQQINANETGLSRYDSTIENTEVGFATALEIARTIIKKVSGLAKETGLSQADLDTPIQIKVRLKADDAVAQGRKSAEGDRKWQLGIIDLQTNLVEYSGYTEEEAEDMINKRIVEDDIRTDPTLRELRVMRAAQELGMEEEYKKLIEQRKAMGATNAPQPTGAGSEGGEPRIGNIKTEMGMGQTDVSQVQSPPRQPPMPPGM